MCLRLKKTIQPLLLAPLGSVFVLGLVAAVRDPASIAVVLYVYPFALAAGLVCVLPILAVVPGLRCPPYWLAVAWGALAAWLFTALLAPPEMWSLSPVGGAAGAASGLVYALAVRRLNDPARTEGGLLQ